MVLCANATLLKHQSYIRSKRTVVDYLLFCIIVGESLQLYVNSYKYVCAVNMTGNSFDLAMFSIWTPAGGLHPQCMYL